MPLLKENRKRKSAAPIQLLELGKLPPQASEIEESVLGAIMLSNNALSQVIDILKPEMFYRESHQLIYIAIHELFSNSEPADILTVTQRLKKNGTLEKIEGGAFFISGLTSRLASSANLETYARIVVEQFLKRELIRVASIISGSSYEDTTDVFELLEMAETQLFSVSQNNIRKNYEKINILLGKAIQQIEDSRDQKFQGIPSGFARLDAITGGWQNSDLIILGARSSMGKSSLMLALARNAAAEFNKPTAIFSLEMTSLQLVMRLISFETEFSGEKLRKGDMTPSDFTLLNEKITKLANAPLFIDDTPALSLFEFRAKAKRLKSEHNIELIVVDYLQLMTLGEQTRGTREQEVSRIADSLKAVAKELGIPIIALSQLSRAVESRTEKSKRPQLSDLRESGAIEQSADVVMLIYRPEYYGILEDEDGNSTQGVAEIIIAKHRNGRVGKENLMFVPHLAKFIEPSYTLFTSDSNQNQETTNASSAPVSSFGKEGLGNNIDEEL